MRGLQDLLATLWASWSVVGPFAGTVVGALIGAVAAYYSGKRRQQAQHEFEILSNLNFASGMIKAYQDVSMFMTKHRSLDIDALDADEDTRRSLLALLSGYQLIAVAVGEKILRMTLVLPFTFGHARAVWTYFRPHVDSIRESLGRPRLYGELEAFIDMYKRQHDKLLAKQAGKGRG